jgi:alanyl-tRNA synthetase
MESTERTYYLHPRLFSTEATVVAAEGAPEAPLLVLDRTIFYPEGGGQPCDLGSMSLAGVEAAVASVREENGRVLHALGGPFPARAGDRVRLSVDPERRLDYSQQHTAQHLLSSICLRLLGASTVSAHFGKDRCAIDFDLPSIQEADMEAVEDLAERVIADDYPIRTHLCPPESIESFSLRRRPPEGAEALRVVEIDGIDFTPCCGLHLASTGAIRLVRVLGAEKYKGMTRLYFAAGGRASSECRQAARVARDAARALGTSVQGIPEALSREAERRKALESSVGALERERAAMEADAAAAELAGRGGGRLARRLYLERGADSLMETAKAFASAGMTALLASRPDLTVQVLSPSPGARLGDALKPALAASGGKGGGGASSFRAVFPDAEGLGRFMEAASGLLSS